MSEQKYIWQYLEEIAAELKEINKNLKNKPKKTEKEK